MIELIVNNGIALLRLNRPEVHNSVNEAMMEEWAQHLDAIEADGEIRTVILTGAGEDTFCAGGDLRYFATLNTRKACLEMSHRMQAILERLSHGKRVVIGAVNGQALGGGCEILTACHFRIAASHATFSFRQAANGIITGWGGGKRLLRLLGKTRALRLFLTAGTIDAAEALRIGLIDNIVDAAALMNADRELAAKINRHPREAVETFLELAVLSDTANWETLTKFEAERFADLWMAEDFRTLVARYSKGRLK